ncbi:MAG: helix-turn-helix domain-containing protein [Myxococcota bacterium]
MELSALGSTPGSASSRFTSFRLTLALTRAQEQCYRQHAGTARFAYNQVVALHIEAKRAKRVCGDGASEVWVPVTPLQCIDVFDKWKTVPAVAGVATGQGPCPGPARFKTKGRSRLSRCPTSSAGS